LDTTNNPSGFPNFLIIGANKGGTSSFYVYLSQHPEIFMSAIKEPMFFLFNDSERKKNKPVESKEPDWKHWKSVSDPEEYRAMFETPPGIKAAGEASTAYLANPACAQRIYDFNPRMKIIAILRNPVSRAFSNYLMYVRLGHEPKSFKACVDEERNGKRDYLPQGRHYLELGYYSDALSTYISRFGKENVKVYLIEELKEKPLWLFRDAFEFLGVDPSFTPDVSEKFNVNENVTRQNSFMKLMTRVVSHRHISKIIPGGMKKFFNRELKLDDKLRSELRELYRDDIIKLQALTGKDLSAWLK
jgi:hypothetical protein